ncbi:hypothetical protein D9M68_356710 [compost metagenome]|uniref:hypothetical protein n=2 Tax=Pseudomonas jinjuensis TaxID=198616 RepID=UPI000A04D13C|nr:hypothetical protein [Pseudomonas jinjuensis]
MRLVLFLLLSTLAWGVSAAPMPFYAWQSRVDGARVCSQTSPGAGWERVAGPFRDAGCRQPIPPSPAPRGLAAPKRAS